MKTIIQKQLFNKNECDYFKSLPDDKSFKRSTVADNNKLGTISENRTSTESLIQLDIDLSNTILEKLNEFGIKRLPNYFIILKYNKNQEFKKHADCGVSYPNRYKTLIIQLSDETEYDGGELCIFHTSETIVASKKIGNTIMFDSSISHCANKIKDGIRYSMVFWLSFNNLGLKQPLI